MELDSKVTNLATTTNLNCKVMEAKDLMIGCLYRVKKDVCLPKGTIVSIKGIDADNRFPERHLIGSATCLPLNSEDRYTYGVWVEYLDPIPLTPDILEKNGFKWLVTCSKSTTYCINEPTIHVSKIKENEEWLICVGATGSTKKRFVEVSCVKYVHELQHALRLCKIEKEIIL